MAVHRRKDHFPIEYFSKQKQESLLCSKQVIKKTCTDAKIGNLKKTGHSTYLMK